MDCFHVDLDIKIERIFRAAIQTPALLHLLEVRKNSNTVLIESQTLIELWWRETANHC